jgi:chromosome segregation ATPase
MPTPTPELNDPTPIQEGIKTIAYAVVGFLTVFFAFSEKGLNLLERVQKLASARQKREEKIEALTERMEAMLRHRQEIVDQQRQFISDNRLQLQRLEQMEKQVNAHDAEIADLQKEIAYLRGKTDKP